MLGLNEVDKVRLQSMYCENISMNEEDFSAIETINLKDVNGFNRPSMNEINWLRCLNSLHKMYMFIKFKDREKFSELLKSGSAIGGLPVVTEYNKKYYISGNGKHRLTIGKCIGVETAIVVVRKAK